MAAEKNFENKVKIQQLQEDNKEAVKGIVEKFEGLLEKSEINEPKTVFHPPENDSPLIANKRLY